MPDMHDFHNPGGRPGTDDWDPNRTQLIHPPERTIGWGSPVSALRSSGAVVATGFLAGAVIAGSMFFGAFFLSPGSKAPAPVAQTPEPRPQVVARALPTPDPAEVRVRTLPSPPRPEPPALHSDVMQPPTDVPASAVRPAPMKAASNDSGGNPGDRTPAPVRWPANPVTAASPGPAASPAGTPAPVATSPARSETPKTTATAAAEDRKHLSAEGYEVFLPQGGVRSPEPASPSVETSAPAPTVSTPPSSPVETVEALPDPSRLRTQAERDAAWELRRRRVRERYQERQRGKAVP
jgi:hypothetical protein